MAANTGILTYNNGVYHGKAEGVKTVRNEIRSALGFDAIEND